MRYEKATLRGQRLQLNGNDFIDCRLINCRLVYSGAGAMALKGTVFVDCTWEYAGDALETVHFLKMLYAMGGELRRPVLETFRFIAPDLPLPSADPNGDAPPNLTS